MKKRKTVAPKPAALKPLPKIDAESILRQLAEMRSKIPHLDDETAAAARKILGERRASDIDRDVTSMTDFDYLSVADGLESLATETPMRPMIPAGSPLPSRGFQVAPPSIDL